MTTAVMEPAARTGPQIWKDDGLCAGHPDPEAWFPPPSMPDGKAEQECYDADGKACPVRDWCFQYAVDRNITDGTWGGVSETRRAVLTGRRQPARREQVGTCPVCRRGTVSYWMKRQNPGQWAGYRRRGGDGICEPCMTQIRRDRKRHEAGP